MAILKIRNENGQVQEILAIRGKKGDGYVLTEADKEEIAGMVDAKSTLIVTVNEDGKTASHTSKQIYDWVQGGGNAVLYDGETYINLASVDELVASFSYISDDLFFYYYGINEECGIDYYEHQLGGNNGLTIETVQSMIDASIANIPVAEGVGF